ncbi:hypothetical protein OA097_00420 [bacterium]|nr:hypothetical protein [bacterium]
MRKLLFLAALIIFSCSKDDSSSNNDDFFKNHGNKIWGDLDGFFTFKNNTFMGGAFDEFGEFYCEKLFIGTINNYIDEELDHIFGEGAELDITNEIIVNTANELLFKSTMLKPATSVDEDIIHIITLTFKVDGENLNYNYNESGNIIYTDYDFTWPIYKGNLDLNFNSCQTAYSW